MFFWLVRMDVNKPRIAPAVGFLVTIAMLVVTAATGSGQAQTTYKASRTQDGQPDLQGVWQAVNTAVWNIQDHPPALGIPAGQGIVEGNEIPYLPLALARRQENYRNRFTDDPESKCFMVGTPRINYMPHPLEIVQTANQVTILYEYVHTSRHIYLNSKRALGRRFARGGRDPLHGSELARSVRQLSQRRYAPGRAMDAYQYGSPLVRSDDRGSVGVCQAFQDAFPALPPHRAQHSASRIRMPHLSGAGKGTPGGRDRWRSLM
jgi:hypothetical protein